MGLFSKTKTVVGTSVQRVIEDAALPDAILTGMTNNLVGDGEQFTEQIMESLASSIGIRAARMYRFGDQGYTYGRPTGNVMSSLEAKSQVQTTIQASVGSVSLAYYHFGPLNLMHIAWKKLIENFGYDPATNKIGSLCTLTKQVYLSDMVANVVDATLEEQGNGSLDVWGTPPNAGTTPKNSMQTAASGSLKGASPYVVNSGLTSDVVVVSYCWTQDEAISGTTVTKPVLYEDSFTLSLSGYDFEKDWHQVKYITSGGVTGYWVYRDRAGTYPVIDAVFTQGYSAPGSFFPWLYYRFNKQAMTVDKTSQGYKDSKKMAAMLNMDFDDICGHIHENPDIADVEQAIMMMGVPADSDNALECRYLFDFFNGVYEQQDSFPNAATQDTTYDIRIALDADMNRSTIVIQDARFKMALNWRNVTRKRVSGTIGEVGTYTSTKTTSPILTHTYRFQQNIGIYTEIQVMDMHMTYYVQGNYSVTSDADHNDILLIPMDYEITEAYSIPEREQLYARSLHYVFNSLVVVKLAWYQTGIFKALLVIVAVVITVMSVGSTWQSIAAALAAGATTAAIVTALVMQVLKYILVNYLIKLFVKEFGAKVAFIAAVVAAVIGSYQAIQAGSVNGAPWAKELLAVSSGLTKGISAQLKDDFSNLLGEQSEFQQFVKDQTKLLETAQELLNHNEKLAPLVIFGEKPQDFYQRTVHSGNIGTISMDAISVFVDVALTLPKISDTV